MCSGAIRDSPWDGHVGAWGLKHKLISHHVKSIIEILRVYLPLLFFSMRLLLSTISIVLLMLLSLVVSFPIKYWIIIADIEDQVP